MSKCKLSPLALGLSLGIIWGASVLITGLTALYFSYGKPFVVAMSTIYVGYEPSVAGSLIGGAFGFIDGLIGGVLVGWLYNRFISCCTSCSACCSCGCQPTTPTKVSKAKK